MRRTALLGGVLLLMGCTGGAVRGTTVASTISPAHAAELVRSFESITGVRVTHIPDGCTATAIGGTGLGRIASVDFACPGARTFSVARTEPDPSAASLPGVPTLPPAGTATRIEWQTPAGSLLVVVADGLEPEEALAIARGLVETP